MPPKLEKLPELPQLKQLPTLPGTRDLKTSSGLYNIAHEAGLKDKADEIVKLNSGEETKKIFSGGFISDIFDVLNVASYGVVGMLKGKSFKEGVKQRESFSDEDSLGRYGLTGVVGGLVLDIVTDPLMYISPWKIITKVPGVAKKAIAGKEILLGKQVTRKIDDITDRTFQEQIGGMKVSKELADKFVWMNGADPVFRDTYETMMRNWGISTEKAANMFRQISKFDEKTAEKLFETKDVVDETGKVLRRDFVRRDINLLQRELDAESFKPVKEAWDNIDKLGKQLVKLNILSKEKYEENLGEYVAQVYKEYEMARDGAGVFKAKALGIRGTKKRVEVLTPEKAKELGKIENPSYVLGITMLRMIRDVEQGKLFSSVNKNFGTDIAQEGFKKLPDTLRLGALAGKYIPENMAKYVDEIVDPKAPLGTQVIGEFKYMKVVFNPATHVRNTMSNTILNWWKLGIGPWRVDLYADAVKEIKNKGYWYQRATRSGLGSSTYATNELKGILQKDSQLIREIYGTSTYNKIKHTIGNLYQKEENLAKLVAFKQFVTKGFTDKDAWKKAEEATFNYAQVTPFVRKLRTAIWGVPFITFPLKATPIAVETALKKTHRVSFFGKFKQAIENLSDQKETERERASEPDYIKDGFYIKLPMKDSDGRSAYFDLTYVIPFGDLLSGQWFERGTSRETGLKESFPEAVASKNPIANLVKEMMQNKTFTGQRIWRETDSSAKQLADLTNHINKTFAPPWMADQFPGGYDDKGERVKTGIAKAINESEDPNQRRTFVQELFKYSGLKVLPVDAEIQENINEWSKKKALQKLLVDHNIVANYTSVFEPK